MRKRTILTMVVVFFLFLLVWSLSENKALKITEYEIDCSENPKLSGFTIVQISDLHNETFGNHQIELLEKVKSANPHMIAITGDFIDCRNPDVEASIEFVKGAVKIAPVFYVPGNHERWVGNQYLELCRQMEKEGVHLLLGKQKDLSFQNENIVCIGVEDPDFYYINGKIDEEKVMEEQLKKFEHSKETFSLLLSHRPELYEIYCQEGIDLVLSGHAHGGQFRLPVIGGLFAPNQGLFPQYDAGMFFDGETNMVVSRGIGNSSFPLRFHNPPEIVVIKLTSKKES